MCAQGIIIYMYISVAVSFTCGNFVNATDDGLLGIYSVWSCGIGDFAFILENVEGEKQVT